MKGTSILTDVESTLMPHMGVLLAYCSLLIAGATAGAQPSPSVVFCNPLPIAYRFQLDEPSRREAADPTMFIYNGSYWLFPSKSGGYFHSPDLVEWNLIEPTGLPLEDYAPTVMDGKDGFVYFTAVGSKAVYSTNNLLSGVWNEVAKLNS